MFTPPYIASEMARERQRDTLARAERQHVAHQVPGPLRAGRGARRIQPLRRLFRLASRPAAAQS
jgi:hypothetical protein